MRSQNKPQYGDRVELEVRITGSEGDGVFIVKRKDGTEANLIEVESTERDVLEEGERYSLKDAIVYRPEDDSRHRYEELREIADENECQSCGGELLFEAEDTEVSELDPDELDEDVYYVVTSETEVYGLSGSDDWIPMSQGRGRTSRGSDVFGRIRCTECGFSVEWRRGMDIEEVEERVEEGTAQRDTGVMYSMDASVAADENVGMATGGSKDANNFRKNVHEGKTPQKDALSYEGLFYDYYFDTGDEDPSGDEGLFYPTYSTAVSENPVNDETEKYLSVGLNSNLTTAEFERKRLNLVVALDVSGSMSSGFREYYYDKTGKRREKEEGEDAEQMSKMEAATESLANLTHHLDEDDRFGVVLYNSQAHVAKPLNPVGETDMDAIRGHIREVSAGGGTNMDDGLGEAVDMLLPEKEADPEEVENRVVFMTDAMPNTGRTGRGSLVESIEDAAEDGIYTTFVGMGIDANEDLIDSLSSVRGANHYFVHSVSEFEKRLNEEFEYMVTPLAFDLSLRVESSEYEIAEVYGSPGDDVEDGEVMNVTTLFPSPKKEGETRGGVVLLKLERKRDTEGTGKVGLEAGWVERDGTEGTELLQVSVPEEPIFDNSGIRKAVALARYGKEMRNWIEAVRSGRGETEGRDDWRDSEKRGEWEQRSVPLVVPDGYEERLKKVRDYIEGEMKILGDDSLEQETEVIDHVLEAS